MYLRPIATFDLSTRCPLRCAHCYFYADPPLREELTDGLFLQRAAALAAQYAIRSAFWVGGEPLLRPRLLRSAMVYFPRNAVVTSGAVPIPADLDAGLFVSLDGPPELHDQLRGQRAFALAERHLSALPHGRFALMTTLTRATLAAIERAPEVVARTRAAGVLFGFSTGNAAHAVTGALRDQAVDRILKLRCHYPGLVLNTPEALALFRQGQSARWRHCVYRSTAIAFDASLTPKIPCTFGARADCEACGCPVVGLQLARAGGDRASELALRDLFPARQPLHVD